MIPHDTITSGANPRVRQAASLRAADARRETGLTLVDGRRELSRAAAAGVEVLEVFVAADALDEIAREGWFAALAARGARVVALPEKPFAKIAFGSRNEGCVAVVRFVPPPLERFPAAADAAVLLVEGVEKPGNLGAILRTADAAGLAGVIVCDGRTDLANPAVIRASLGTVFTVPVAAATTRDTIAWCRDHGRRVIAAMPDGSRLWHEPPLTGGTAILLGSEALGVSPEWRRAAAAGTIALDSVRLPMHGAADSLNVSATAAVLAYESLRQRNQRPAPPRPAQPS
jgi:TrmH family RNA methyltransferase